MDIKTKLAIYFAAATTALLSSPGLHAQKIGQDLSSRIELPEQFQVKPLYKADTLAILVCGDMMMHQAQLGNAVQADGSFDFSSYFSLVSDKISQADIAICNMEVTFAGEPFTGYPCFSAPEEFAEEVAKAGFDIFLCANNHIFDRGAEGAQKTLEQYRKLKDKYGTAYTGLASDGEELAGTTPLILVMKGIRLAFMNFTYGTNSSGGSLFPTVNRLSDKELLETSLSKAAEADFTLMLPHWGEEYILTHSKEQEKMAREMIESGADMIIGSHPHVVQDSTVIDGVHVLYSLGNMVSNMSAPNTQLELMATISLIRDCNGDISVGKPVLTWLWCSRPGGYSISDYIVVPVEDFIGRRDEWAGKWDYDKMVGTYERIVPEHRE